jgi:putative endonuclease
VAEAYIYIVECADGTLYTGWTTDLARRVATHNAGRGADYTRGRRPVRLVYWEEHSSRTSARRRELILKRMKRARKLSLIAAAGHREESPEHVQHIRGAAGL